MNSNNGVTVQGISELLHNGWEICRKSKNRYGLYKFTVLNYQKRADENDSDCQTAFEARPFGD